MNGRFLINREDGKVMGVAAGLADWSGIDALLIRLGLVAALLLTGPLVILFYVLTGWLAADRCSRASRPHRFDLVEQLFLRFVPSQGGRRSADV